MTIMTIFFSILTFLIVIVAVFMRQPKFGRTPFGERLETMKQSSNYRDDSFQNIHPTSAITEGVSYGRVMKEFFLERKPRIKPVGTIPSVKTDIKKLEQDALIWFGHSSYYIRVDGKRILVDPVLSGSASPIRFTTKSFNGTDAYSVEDFPEIDYLFITHDHWDHLDHATLLKLKTKVSKVICPLGVQEHLLRWGFDKKIIFEKDWNDTLLLDLGFTAHFTSARHFSGRTFKRNRSLWTSYVLQTPTMQIFIGGDSGYDSHFVEIGEKFGGFDLAILENGQYDKNWKYIHMMPDEVLQAAIDLKARKLFPVHNSKFALANHSWDTPLREITEFNRAKKLKILTPQIGEILLLKSDTQVFKNWWEGIG